MRLSHAESVSTRTNFVIRLIRAASLLAAIVAVSLGTADPATSKPTALQVAATGAPQRVHGSDGREHIDYDLVITNSFTADVTLTSLVVGGNGKRLLTLSGDSLAAATYPLSSAEPTSTIPPSSAVKTLVDVTLPASAGRAVPKRVNNRLTYTFAAGAPAEQIIGSTTVRGPDLRVDRGEPIEIAPPLRGGGWLSANACCDLSLEHRTFLFPSNGTFVTSEMFAIDYIRLIAGRFYNGDGTQNTDWFGYGAPVRAVAGGTVVSVVNDMPEVAPFASLAGNPSVTRPSQFPGNRVVVKIRPGVFAEYFHLQTGSAGVEVGERVRTGQKVGLLGNSGNTAGPHLHFSINDGRYPLTSNSLPFEIDRFGFEGTAGATPTPGELTLTGRPHEARRSHPLATSVSDYSR